MIRIDWDPVAHIGQSQIPTNGYGVGWAAAFVTGRGLVTAVGAAALAFIPMSPHRCAAAVVRLLRR